MLHYSLRTLIAMVAFVAVACAALMNATGWIASTASTLTVVALAVATLVAVLVVPSRRGPWAGFAVVGWAYLLVALGPMDAGFKGTLWTTVLLQKAAAASPQAVLSIQRPQPVYMTTASVAVTPQGPTPVLPKPLPPATSMVVNSPNTDFVQAFQQIGHAIATLVIGFLGALLGTLVVARNNRPMASSIA